MTLEIYRSIHIVGIALVLFGLAGVLFASAALGVRSPLPKPVRVVGFAFHGVGLFMLLISGFGMLARMGLTQNIPSWIYLKLMIWVLLGLAISASKRLGNRLVTLSLIYIGLVILAAGIVNISR